MISDEDLPQGSIEHSVKLPIIYLITITNYTCIKSLTPFPQKINRQQMK